jgi:heptosyltransferase I
MASPQNPRALFIRLDRIGDLVLTLPVDQSLGSTSVDWWIPQRLSFVTQLAKPQRRASEVSRQIGFGEFWRLMREVKSRHYDYAAVFHAPWWVGLLLTLARVPVRIGVQSQWHSFLFFNRGVRQKRSRADKSELEFNYRLIEEGLGRPEGSLERRTLELDASDLEPLTAHGLAKNEYVVVHPGMSGSARNWPVDRYRDLVLEFAKHGTVAITGTASDSIYVSPLKGMLANAANVVFLDEKLTGLELVSVVGNAKLVFAPSTGVVHLAASTGTPTLGLYSPVRVQRALRWGPQGAKTATLTPLVNCPGELECLREACPHWDCMPRVTVEEAIEASRKI